MTTPHYAYSPRLLIPLLRVLLGIRSSLSRDTMLMLSGAHPPPHIMNPENIPPASPFILAINHYDRPGLGSWWVVAAIVTTVAARRTEEPHEIHFAMAREWWYPRGIGRLIKQPLTRWFFGQVGKAYGMIRLPPALGLEEFRGAGALAIRGALALTRGENPELVGIAPEGNTGAGFALCQPPCGAGLFLLLLTHDHIPILPVGIWEDDDNTLTVRFGAPFDLRVPRDLPRDERDTLAVRQVMLAIGKLLPDRMGGAYREEIRNAKVREGMMNKIRVLALAVFWRGDEILVMEGYDAVKRETFYRPPGGGVEFGERVMDALRREMREELGAEIEHVRLLRVMENLFVFEGETGHQIIWMHDAVLVDPVFYARDEIIINEDGTRGRAVWKSLREFEAGGAILYPDGLLGLLKNKTEDE